MTPSETTATMAYTGTKSAHAFLPLACPLMSPLLPRMVDRPHLAEQAYWQVKRPQLHLDALVSRGQSDAPHLFLLLEHGKRLFVLPLRPLLRLIDEDPGVCSETE